MDEPLWLFPWLGIVTGHPAFESLSHEPPRQVKTQGLIPVRISDLACLFRLSYMLLYQDIPTGTSESLPSRLSR